MPLLKSSAKARYIRGLENIVERAVILCDGKTFSVEKSWLRARIISGIRGG